MAELLPFFVGVLVCGVVVQAGDLAHQVVESRMRIVAARRRVSRAKTEGEAC